MSLDVFGRGGGETLIKTVRGPPGIGFKLTSDNQYNIQNKRLCKVAEPIEPEDAVNLRRLRKAITNIWKEIKELEFMLKTVDQRLEGFTNTQNIDSKEDFKLHQRHAEFIEQLDSRINKLEQWIKPT